MRPPLASFPCLDANDVGGGARRWRQLKAHRRGGSGGGCGSCGGWRCWVASPAVWPHGGTGSWPRMTGSPVLADLLTADYLTDALGWRVASVAVVPETPHFLAVATVTATG